MDWAPVDEATRIAGTLHISLLALELPGALTVKVNFGTQHRWIGVPEVPPFFFACRKVFGSWFLLSCFVLFLFLFCFVACKRSVLGARTRVGVSNP